MVKTKAARRRHLVKALRSGKFQQGKYALEHHYPEDGVTHCCLGVACRVAIEDGLDLPVYKPNGIAVSTVFGGDGDSSTAALPRVVRDWYGFSTECGDYGDQDALIEDNDSKDRTFEQIADTIEAAPEGLFV